MNEAAPVAPADAGQAGQGNAVQPSWYGADVADEVKGYVKNKGWDGTDGPLKVITAYQSLEKFHGVPADQLIRLPKDMNDNTALAPIYDRLGRPAKAEDYKYTPPQGLEVSGEDLTKANALAHKLGLNNVQHNELVNAMINESTTSAAESERQNLATQTAQMNEVRREWGDAFEERSELARRAVRNALPAGLNDEGRSAVLTSIENAIGTANFLKMFANLGAKLGEDMIPRGDSTQSFGYSPEQAKADLSALMDEMKADPKRLRDFNENKGADVAKISRLNKVIAG